MSVTEYDIISSYLGTRATTKSGASLLHHLAQYAEMYQTEGQTNQTVIKKHAIDKFIEIFCKTRFLISIKNNPSSFKLVYPRIYNAKIGRLLHSIVVIPSVPDHALLIAMHCSAEIEEQSRGEKLTEDGFLRICFDISCNQTLKNPLLVKDYG